MITPSTTATWSADESPRSLLAARPRPPRAGAFAAALAFGWRGLLKIKHLPEQLLDVIAIPIVFTLMFTYLFGGALAGSTGKYLQYILPGTLVMAVALVTMFTGVGLNTDISKGVFDRFKALPIWRPAPLVGGLIGDAGRYLLAAALVMALGLVMGFRPAGGVAGVLAALGLVVTFAFALSWVWMALGLLLRTPTAVMSIGTVVVFPLTLASNVFVQPRTMPGWLQAVVQVNPVSHLVTATRGLMSGMVSDEQIGWVLVASATLTLLCAPLTVYLYHKKQ
jgi:ABC-2 type transport system permease protein